MEERWTQRNIAISSTIASLILIIALASFTDPNRNIIFSVLFFLALFVFIFGFGAIIIHLQTGRLSLRSKRKLILFDSLLMVILMLASSKSISWINLLIIILIIGGLNFYFNSRKIDR